MGGDEDSPEQSCACGCRGFNGEQIRHLRLIRHYAAEAREARAKAVHAARSKAVLRRRREDLDRLKREFLELLWFRGQRKIDRVRLREHAAEHYRAELAELRRCIAETPKVLREYRARLHGIVLMNAFRNVGASNNMDLPDVGVGAVVYLPVNTKGGLLYLGDCHAAQGDGELCGVAIEHPTVTTVQIDLIKGWSIAWPRLETADVIMTVDF